MRSSPDLSKRLIAKATSSSRISPDGRPLRSLPLSNLMSGTSTPAVLSHFIIVNSFTGTSGKRRSGSFTIQSPPSPVIGGTRPLPCHFMENLGCTPASEKRIRYSSALSVRLASSGMFPRSDSASTRTAPGKSLPMNVMIWKSWGLLRPSSREISLRSPLSLSGKRFINQAGILPVATRRLSGEDSNPCPRIGWSGSRS